MAVLLTLSVAVLLVDDGLGHVALVTGLIDGTAADAGLTRTGGGHCVELSNGKRDWFVLRGLEIELR